MTAVAEFTLPADLEAHAPAEARGLPRDGVRMMVSRQHLAGSADRAITHHWFTDLPGLLLPGRPAGGQQLAHAAGRGAGRP